MRLYKTALKKLIENCNSDELVFPSHEGGYISPKNFTNKAWIKTLASIIELTEENELYAPPYCTRHTFITLCLAKNIPPKDIAGWCGTSIEMIYKHYVKNNSSLEVPEF
jgi:integrase